MKIALMLPAEGPRWGSVRVPNLGNEMICQATRRVLKRLPSQHLEVEEFTYLKRPSLEELKRINNCDRAIFVGTNIFQPHVVGWEWRTEDLEQIEVPYLLYGVGYSGPLQGDPKEICEETKELVNWSRGAEAIGVRDPHTVRWLKRFGVSSELIGCPVIAYADVSPTIVLGEGRPVLAVRHILLHSPGDEAVAAQRAMIDWFFKEYSDGICVVQEPADLSLLEGKPVVTDFSDIVSVLSQARFVCSARLHAGMLALSFGRPAVFLAHDTRVASFCELVGLPSRQLSFEGLKEAIHAVKTIEQGNLAEFSLAVVRIPFFRERLERFLDRVLTKAKAERVSLHEMRTRKILVQLQAGFYELKQELIELKGQLQARDRELAEYREQLQVRDKELIDLQQVEVSLKGQLQARDCELAGLRQGLAEIYSSTAWQLLDRYWRWVNRLLPAGTRRRRLYSRMLRAVNIVLREGWRGLGHRLRAKVHPQKAPPLHVGWERAGRDKIRLLILIPTMGAGGMERCAEVLLKHFKRDLFELGLVMIFDRPLFYRVPADVKTFVLERYPQPTAEARLGELAQDVAGRYQHELTWLEATAYKFALLTRKLHPDVVLAQDFFASAIALLAGKYMPKDVKIIGSLHNQYSTFLQTIQQGDLYAALIRRYFNEADRIIAVSQGIAQDLIENFDVRPDVITVIHNPMDLVQIERLAEELITEHCWFNENVPVLLFVGRLNPQKGLAYLLQATAQARKLERFRVSIIGEGEQRQELEALAGQLGVADDVLFLGRQGNPFKFMRRATAFTLPSVVEGLPYVIPEAMACGCPIIATDCAPGVRELLGEGERGVLVQPKDPNALAEAILEVLRNKDLRERLTQAGLQYVKQFAAEKIVSQYEEVVKAHVSIHS